MPVRQARPRSLKPPRWSAERRASRVMGRKAPRKRLVRRVMACPRVPRTHPNVSRRSAHPSIRVSEAKEIIPRATARRKRKVIVQRDTNGSFPNSSCAGLTRASIFFAKKSLRRLMDCRVKPGNDRVDGTRAPFRLLDLLGTQPAPVRNDRWRNSTVSGLLFTGSAATATCRAFQRPSRIQVAARLPTSSSSPIKPANTGSTPMPRTTLASRVRSPSQSSPW